MLIKNQKIEKFLEEVASRAPTPGGGAVAAVTGAAAAALVEMVVNLTKNDPTSSVRLRSGLRGARERTQQLRKELLKLAGEDAAAFDAVMAAFKIPKDEAGRKEKIQSAFKGAAETPLEVAKLAKEVNMLAKEILRVGNKNAASDAKSAIYLSEAAKNSALANVEINLAYIKDRAFVAKTEKEVASLKEV